MFGSVCCSPKVFNSFDTEEVWVHMGNFANVLYMWLCSSKLNESGLFGKVRLYGAGIQVMGCP